MGEQQMATDSQETGSSACPHLEAAGKRWGDSISEERQTELDDLAAKQAAWVTQPETTRGDSPLEDFTLTGAEVFWLAQGSLAGPDADEAALADAGARLRSEDFSVRRRVDLSKLHLEGVDLNGAHLEGARLRGAHLEDADLREAHLEGAGLRGTFLDSATTMQDATLYAPGAPATPRVADARWGVVNLAVLDWTPFTERSALLGDEWLAHTSRPAPYQEPDKLKAAPRRERAAARAAHAAAQQRAP